MEAYAAEGAGEAQRFAVWRPVEVPQLQLNFKVCEQFVIGNWTQNNRSGSQMDYVKKTLGTDEEYLYRAKFNWTYDAISWFWLLVAAVPLFFWAFVQLSDSSASAPSGRPYFVLGVAGASIGAVIWLSRSVHKWTTVIAVTSSRVILKVGLIARKSREISLLTIEKINVRQSLYGRFFGYGMLIIRGTGGAKIELPSIDRPLALRREIRQAKQQAHTTE